MNFPSTGEEKRQSRDGFDPGDGVSRSTGKSRRALLFATGGSPGEIQRRNVGRPLKTAFHACKIAVRLYCGSSKFTMGIIDR